MGQLSPLRSAFKRLVVSVVRRISQTLAGGAEPGSTACCADLLDRSATPRARLAFTAVDLEVVLHAAGSAVGRAVVAQRRTLALDAGLERRAEAPVQGAELGDI